MASRQVRDETLSMFYADNLLLVYLPETKDISAGHPKLTSWLRSVGCDNAAGFRDLVVVYRKVGVQRDVEERLLRLMKAGGVKTGEASVRWNRIEGASKLLEGGDVYVMRLKWEQVVRQSGEVSNWSGKEKSLAEEHSVWRRDVAIRVSVLINWEWPLRVQC